MWTVCLTCRNSYWPMMHFNDITQPSWYRESLTTRLFIQLLVQAHIKSKIIAPHNWPFVSKDPVKLKLIEAETKWTPFFLMPFWYAIYWMKTFEFQIKFHWHMFPRVVLTINHRKFRKWVVTKQNAKTKLLPFHKLQFQTNFVEWKCMYLD